MSHFSPKLPKNVPTPSSKFAHLLHCKCRVLLHDNPQFSYGPLACLQVRILHCLRVLVTLFFGNMEVGRREVSTSRWFPPRRKLQIQHLATRESQRCKKTQRQSRNGEFVARICAKKMINCDSSGTRTLVSTVTAWNTNHLSVIVVRECTRFGRQRTHTNESSPKAYWTGLLPRNNKYLDNN